MIPRYKPLKRSTKPIARSAIKRTKRHPETRVGKLGIVRLTGKALEALRRQCWDRDESRCQWDGCGRWCRWERGFSDSGHMAHRHGRGAGGSDVLDNVRVLCGEHHLINEHNPKAVPKK